MQPYYQIIVVIPIGPNVNIEFIEDSIKGFIHYTAGTYKILISDDSLLNKGEELKKKFPDIDVLKNKKNFGMKAGLYIHLANTYNYCLETYNFETIFKYDDDALVIGKGLDTQVLKLLNDDPLIGMVGRLQSRTVTTDHLGCTYDNFYPRKTLIAATFTWRMIKRPLVNLALRDLLFKAFDNGYELGESIFGGAYYISRKCLIQIRNNGLLPKKVLRSAILEEDHIFSLLTVALGFKLIDLSSENQPFAVAWKKLPASPDRLLKENKKIIHSVRSWENMDENDVRQYFADIRNNEVLAK